jgi:hypothetical protein
MSRRPIAFLPVPLLALMLAAGSVHGQELQGVAVGPDGAALPDVVVALHRVGEMGVGASVASTTTDADGRFQFQIETGDPDWYFAAMRYQGAMYIGPLAMAGTERVTGYVLAADPESEAGAVASALSREGAMGTGDGAAAQRPASTGQEAGQAVVWAAAFLALAAVGLFLATAPRYRRRRTRDALVELARLENQLAEGPAEAEREELLRRRAQLRGRLAPST